MVALIGLDPISTSYCSLAFKMERLFPGFVDAYFGPPGVKAMGELGDAPEASDLLVQARELALAVVGSELEPSRKRFLGAQVEAMVTICRGLAGEGLPYREEVRGCFDIEAPRAPDADLDAAQAELDAILPGSGNLRAGRGGLDHVRRQRTNTWSKVSEE